MLFKQMINGAPPSTSSIFHSHNSKTHKNWMPKQASRDLCGGEGSGCLLLV